MAESARTKQHSRFKNAGSLRLQLLDYDSLITPSEGPNQVPFQQPQPYPGQNGQNWSTQTLPPQQPKKNQSNILGLIALITAVIGFIFACIPGALIIGWILLPVAFILGLVSLFLQGKSKWMGITALILSIVGTGLPPVHLTPDL